MDDITLLYTEDLHTALGYWVHPGVPLPNMSDIKRAANPWIPRHSFDTPKYHMITKPPREDSQIRLIATLVLGLLIHLPYQRNGQLMHRRIHLPSCSMQPAPSDYVVEQ